MDDDRYYRNELALSGLDAWITREPDYDDGPPERESCCPEFTEMCTNESRPSHERCDVCGGCIDCELEARRRVAPVVVVAAPLIERDDEEVPF